MAIAAQICELPSQEDRDLSLLSQLHSVSLALPFSLPLYAGLELAGVNYRKCRVMSSKKLPLFLVVRGQHAREDAQHPRREEVSASEATETQRWLLGRVQRAGEEGR